MVILVPPVNAVGTPSPYKCQAAISELATDLKGVKLTKKKTEQIFTILFDARRLCALGHQKLLRRCHFDAEGYPALMTKPNTDPKDA